MSKNSTLDHTGKITKQAHSEELLSAALQWWEGKRPSDFTVQDHIENPDINCSSGEEVQLAYVVAAMLNRNNSERLMTTYAT